VEHNTPSHSLYPLSMKRRGKLTQQYDLLPLLRLRGQNEQDHTITEISTLTHFAWVSRISLATHALTRSSPRGWQHTISLYGISKSHDFNCDFVISTVISTVISWFLQWFQITVISDFYSHSPQNSMISLHSYDFTTDFWFQYINFRFLYKFLISI